MNKMTLLLTIVALGASVQAKAHDIVFSQADTNADGKLDKIEFQSAHQRSKGAKYDAGKAANVFAKKDVNKDGFITEAELAKKKGKGTPKAG